MYPVVIWPICFAVLLALPVITCPFCGIVPISLPVATGQFIVLTLDQCVLLFNYLPFWCFFIRQTFLFSQLNGSSLLVCNMTILFCCSNNHTSCTLTICFMAPPNSAVVTWSIYYIVPLTLPVVSYAVLFTLLVVSWPICFTRLLNLTVVTWPIIWFTLPMARIVVTWPIFCAVLLTLPVVTRLFSSKISLFLPVSTWPFIIYSSINFTSIFCCSIPWPFSFAVLLAFTRRSLADLFFCFTNFTSCYSIDLLCYAFTFTSLFCYFVTGQICFALPLTLPVCSANL